jgi:hypothetical protein
VVSITVPTRGQEPYDVTLNTALNTLAAAIPADIVTDAALDTSVTSLIEDPASDAAVALNATIGVAVEPLAPRVTDAAVNPFAVTLWTSTSVQCIGYSPEDGRMFYVGSDLYASDDFGATFSPAKGLPASGGTVLKIVRFNGYNFAITAQGKVWRSPLTTRDAAFTWTDTGLTMTSGSAGFPTAFFADTVGGYLYAGEYADPTGQRPKLWRVSAASAVSGGPTWEVSWQPGFNTRHHHSVARDPFAEDTLYLCGGDGQGYAIMRSVDNGATWSEVQASANYQAVQISFDEKWVYFACDGPFATVLVMDRETLAFQSMSSDWHALTPVPFPTRTPRVVTDAVFTGGQTTFTSATAAFTADDVGRQIGGLPTSQAVQPNAYIQSVTNGTTAVMSAFPRYSASGQTVGIRGDAFYRRALYGAVDPATGVYYCVANDTTGGGTTYGLFAIPYVGGPCILLDAMAIRGPGQMYIAGGYLHFHQHRRPLMAPA